MKNQTIIQIKKTLFLLSANINLHLISWLGNSLPDDVDSSIEATHSILGEKKRKE
ncbi:MAG: hypothetical protein ACTS73_01080 [Arsenophonus sp. NEOnobi-MAG3]